MSEFSPRAHFTLMDTEALKHIRENKGRLHQDFTIEGSRVMIEMYSDRVEISSPGLPSIEINRFIDEWKSRNESLGSASK